MRREPALGPLDERRDAKVDAREHVVEARHPLVAVEQPQRRQLGERAVADPAAAAGHALERLVVKDDGSTIGGEMHVELHGMARARGGLECRERVFRTRRRPLHVVKPTVRDGLCSQPARRASTQSVCTTHARRGSHRAVAEERG